MHFLKNVLESDFLWAFLLEHQIDVSMSFIYLLEMYQCQFWHNNLPPNETNVKVDMWLILVNAFFMNYFISLNYLMLKLYFY